MKKKHILYLILVLLACFIWYSFFRKTKEIYILPNGYRGFFGVIYQANKMNERLEKDGSKLFMISNEGVYESGYRFTKGSITQEFYYLDDKKINEIGFKNLGNLTMKSNNSIIELMRKQKSELFCINIVIEKIDQGANSIAIYYIGSGEEILKLSQKSEEIYKAIINRNWAEDKGNITMNIKRLNEEHKENKYPFD